MNIVGLVRDASTIFSSHLQLQQNLLPVMGVLQRSIKTSIYQSQCSYTIFKKCCLNHWTFSPSDTARHDLGDTVLRGESLGEKISWNVGTSTSSGAECVSGKSGGFQEETSRAALKLRMAHVSQLWLQVLQGEGEESGRQSYLPSAVGQYVVVYTFVC